jgi:hypothetical protein
MIGKYIKIIWQLPQYISGLIFKYKFKTKIVKVEKYKDSTIYYLSGMKEFGVSFGIYIFVSDDERGKELILHEYGHSIQSKIFGWFFLLIIGLLSVIRFKQFSKKEKHIKTQEEKIDLWKKYYAKYTENWANKLGGVDVNKWKFFKK